MRRRRVEPPPTPGAADDPLDPGASAAAAGLRHATDMSPGIRRRSRRGGGFEYIDPRGRPLRDPEQIQRIRHLAIPPAWRDVWICPSPRGHLQATGRDARGRKQYRYHADWRRVRDEAKFTRLCDFGRALPGLRRRVADDLGRRGLPRDKVVATVVRLLDDSLIRVGNEEYARENSSFGLTTLRDEHVDLRGSRLRFEFRGKGGRRHRVEVRDRRVARVVSRCLELPGHELFQYLDRRGVRSVVESGDVNEYLRRATGHAFTAKDFRTWAGTVLAAGRLAERGGPRSQAEAKRQVVEAVGWVAERLGNTPAICRRCYVHPDVLDAHLRGGLAAAPAWGGRPASRGSGAGDRAGDSDGASAGLPEAEARALDFLCRTAESGASSAA